VKHRTLLNIVNATIILKAFLQNNCNINYKPCIVNKILINSLRLVLKITNINHDRKIKVTRVALIFDATSRPDISLSLHVSSIKTGPTFTEFPVISFLMLLLRLCYSAHWKDYTWDGNITLCIPIPIPWIRKQKYGAMISTF
jgi:hypothetical protein